VSALLGPVLGRVIEARGGRPVLCGSNLAFAAGLTVLSFAQGPVSLIVSWLILGIAMGAGFYEAGFAALTRRYGHDSRNAITGITLVAGFASTVGWPATALLEHGLGWRGACAAWALRFGSGDGGADVADSGHSLAKFRGMIPSRSPHPGIQRASPDQSPHQRPDRPVGCRNVARLLDPLAVGRAHTLGNRPADRRLRPPVTNRPPRRTVDARMSGSPAPRIR
jgi:hypothetical protein